MSKKDRIIVTFPDESIVVFNSALEASRDTGIAETSILRACSRRSKPIDGYTFRYENQKAKLGQQNKRKGNNFELQVVKALKEIGYNTVTARSESKSKDNNKIDIIDLDDILPTNIQTKYTTNCPSYFTIRNQCTDKSKPFTVIWKKSITGENSPGTIAMIEVDFFYELLKLYKQSVK